MPARPAHRPAGRGGIGQPASQLGLEARGELVEQGPHIGRRRPLRRGAPAERRQQEAGLIGQGGLPGGAGQRRLGRRRGTFRIARFAPGMGQRQMRLRRLRQQPGGGLERRQRGSGVAQCAERLAQIAQGHRILRRAGKGGAQGQHRFRQPPGLGQGGAVIGQEHRRLGLLCQGALDMPEGAGGIAPLAGQHAEQVMRVGVLRLPLQHLAVEPLGAGQVALGMTGGAGLEQGQRIGGPEIDGLGEGSAACRHSAGAGTDCNAHSDIHSLAITFRCLRWQNHNPRLNQARASAPASALVARNGRPNPTRRRLQRRNRTPPRNLTCQWTPRPRLPSRVRPCHRGPTTPPSTPGCAEASSQPMIGNAGPVPDRLLQILKNAPRG